MRVTLNVGAATPWKLTRAVAFCSGMTADKAAFRFLNQGVDEPTLIVAFDADWVDPPESFFTSIQRLCHITDEDCVAVKIGHQGFILGPNPEPYQPFDHELFSEF